jgi:uncharacterized membrane-anchored protein YjiN (DUF445 family)
MTEAEKRQRLRQMRLAALSAVALMLALFVASSLLRDRFSAAQWLRAFSEAGIAGALADWYAVVALFRHPLGLPFPHTAIIPKNKDRIADSVGAFIETHFLTSQNVVDRLARLDLAATMSEWLRQSSNSRDLADLLCDLIPPTLETVDDAEIRALVERLAVSQMESVDLVAVADRLITTIADLDLDRALAKRVLQWVRDWMSRNREAIKFEFGRASRYTPGFLDAYIVNRFVDGVANLLNEAAEDPQHQIWGEIDRAINELRENLRTSPALRKQITDGGTDALRSLVRNGAARALWDKIKRSVIADLADERSRIRSWVSEGFQRLGAAIAEDRGVQRKLNAWQVAMAERSLPLSRPAIGRWIADIVKSWDTEQITGKLETEIGTDLQYIRLNGAVVGGLVGLVLHAAA